MTNRVGGPGKGTQVDLNTDSKTAGADADVSTQDGAPNARRTARPKSMDIQGLGLASQLEKKLATAATSAVTGPKGSDPRPHSGAADAAAIEKLIAGGDATALAGALYEKMSHLVTIDRREGIQLNQNATEGEINRFKVMLQVLQEKGKLDDLRGALHGPSAGPRLVFGTVEDVMSKLVASHGTKAEKKTWNAAANATPPATGTGGMAPPMKWPIDAGMIPGAIKKAFADVPGATVKTTGKPNEWSIGDRSGPFMWVTINSKGKMELTGEEGFKKSTTLHVGDDFVAKLKALR